MNPRDDFYTYCNYEWLQNTTIPEGHSKWGTFNILAENNYNKIKILLQENKLSNNIDNIKLNILNEQFLNNHEKTNIFPNYEISGFLNKIKLINNKPDLYKFIIDNFIMNQLDSPIGFSVYPSFNNSKLNILHIDSGGLGLPDKEYYFSSDKKEIREKYIQFMIKLNNNLNLNLDIDSIYHIEKYLAEYEYSNIDKRNPNLMNNELSFQVINTMYPEINLSYFFNKINVKPNNINIINTNFLKKFIELWNISSIDILKNYYIFLYIRNIGKYVNANIEKIMFDFYGKVLTGVDTMKPLWRRSIINIENNMGTPLSKLFVNKHFPINYKQKCNELVSYIKKHFAEILKNNNWMGDTTKQKAIKKLENMNFQIGYPDKWKDYTNINISNSNNYLINILNCKNYDYKFDIDLLYKPIDNNVWHMNPHEVNAYYSPQENKMVFPAGILQDPFFDINDMPKSFGGIGCVIGHEITHGFDDEGRKFDHNGNLNNWWTHSDLNNFNSKIKVLEELFNSHKVLGKYINGKLKLGENLADLGGLTISLRGLNEWLDMNKVTDKNKYFRTFFENYANVWKCLETEKSILLRLETDPHSQPILRVNLILPNLDKFNEIYNINPDNKLYIPPNMRTNLWV